MTIIQTKEAKSESSSFTRCSQEKGYSWMQGSILCGLDIEKITVYLKYKGLQCEVMSKGENKPHLTAQVQTSGQAVKRELC